MWSFYWLQFISKKNERTFVKQVIHQFGQAAALQITIQIMYCMYLHIMKTSPQLSRMIVFSKLKSFLKHYFQFSPAFHYLKQKFVWFTSV